MPRIHSSAIVSDEADIAEDVDIGPWCVVAGRVTLGRGVRLISNVHLEGPVRIGEGTIVYPFACIGFPAQDTKFSLGDPTAGVVIGRECIIREHVTIHAATNVETPTTLGDNVFMMVESHVGHDGRIDDGVVMVNNSAIGGHGHIGAKATIGGGSMIHQHGRIGRLAFVTGGIGVANDVPPFCTAGDRNTITGINVIGLRRAGFSREDVTGVRQAFREALRDPYPVPEMIARLRAIGRTCPPVNEMADFIDTPGRRPICASIGRPPRTLVYLLRKLKHGEDIPGLDDDDE